VDDGLMLGLNLYKYPTVCYIFMCLVIIHLVLFGILTVFRNIEINRESASTDFMILKYATFVLPEICLFVFVLILPLRIVYFYNKEINYQAIFGLYVFWYSYNFFNFHDVRFTVVEENDFEYMALKCIFIVFFASYIALFSKKEETFGSNSTILILYMYIFITIMLYVETLFLFYLAFESISIAFTFVFIVNLVKNDISAGLKYFIMSAISSTFFFIWCCFNCYVRGRFKRYNSVGIYYVFCFKNWTLSIFIFSF